MVLIQRHLGPVRDRMTFFPDDREMASLVREMTPWTLLRVTHPLGSMLDDPTRVSYNDSRTATIDLTRGVEELRKSLHTTCGYHIRRALKLGDRIEVARDDQHAEQEFLTLFNRLIRVTRHARRLSRRRLRGYLSAGNVWVIRLDGEALCGHVMIADQDARRSRLILSASKRHESHERSRTTARLNRLLHWEEILSYKDAGYESYDFGGADDSGRTRFKMSFGAGIEGESWGLFAGGAVRRLLNAYEMVGPLKRRFSM